jgi:opacity protein-like surface antigen
MVKAIALTAVILAATAMTSAAEEAQPGIDIVLFAGASHSSFSGADNTLLGDGGITGATGGLGLMLRVNPDFGFEVDVRFTQKGGEGQVDITDYTGANNGPTIIGQGKTELTYAEIPLLLTFQLPTGEKSFLRAFFGPSFDILMNANFNGVIEGEQQDINIEDGVSDFEYAVVVGAGWMYDAGPASLWLDGRWAIALSSVDDTARDRDINNQTWEFALGVGIPLARE